jgi:exonuclease VII small subunit
MAKKRAASPESSDDAGEEPSFETELRRLSQVVERLESGDLGLEESLALF